MKMMLWFAPGVLFYEAEMLGQGTPKTLNCVLFSTPRPLDIGDCQVLATKMQTALFELDSVVPAADVAHYTLANGPPDGYRWILVKPGRICVEQISP